MRPHRFPAIPRRTGLIALFTVAVVLLTTALPSARPTLAQGYPPPEDPISLYLWYEPWNPSTITEILFHGGAYDPTYPDVAGCSWDFDDGTSESSACNPTHTYAAPGFYDVQLTVTLVDGRTGTTVQTIEVVAPRPPQVSIGVSEWEPSTVDNLEFSTYIYDPEGRDIVECVWDFGDGTPTTTVTGCPPVHHQYALDGDYTVKVRATTSDGRVGETEQLVQIRTRDVSIAKLSVPQAARAGQTRTIIVGVANRRSDEFVRVTLYKNGPDGYYYTEIGRSTQLVPARQANRTTTFSFNYTFTDEDARNGKVTFRVMAEIVNAEGYNVRDIFPADNQATALPTKVNAR